MPVTRRRAAAAAPVVVVEEEDDDERATAIDISSDSEEGSEPSSEEDDTSDEDFVEICDSDNEASGGEGSGDESEEEVEAEQLGADRSEAACCKIAGLLRSGRSLEGIKLVECKAYLKKIGLSQTGDIATCIDRIMLHWRFKNGNQEKIYPRSSFCINCKGDVCRGDAVLFKQKVYEKSGKRHAKCIGKRIVAGKVIKESYGKEKQQHTFTIQVFWSEGAGKLPPLHLLLVKGRNLYRMMTFRQPWPNEAERSKALEDKHNRGDAARRVCSLNRNKSAGNTLKGKKTLEMGKHQARSGRSNCGSNITEVDKGKKRSAQSSNFDPPDKKSKKEGCKFPFTLGKNALVVEGLRKIMPTLIRAAFLMAAKFLNAMEVGRTCRKAVIWHGSTQKLGYVKGDLVLRKRTALVKLNLKEEASLWLLILVQKYHMVYHILDILDGVLVFVDKEVRTLPAGLLTIELLVR